MCLLSVFDLGFLCMDFQFVISIGGFVQSDLYMWGLNQAQWVFLHRSLC